MGLWQKMFGSSKPKNTRGIDNVQEAQERENRDDYRDRKSDRARYDELLKRGMKPSEALHTINFEKNRARETRSRPFPKFKQKQPQKLQRSRPRQGSFVNDLTEGIKFIDSMHRKRTEPLISFGGHGKSKKSQPMFTFGPAKTKTERKRKKRGNRSHKKAKRGQIVINL